MATAKWATPGAEGSNLAGTALDSLGNGSAAAAITYDNSTALDLYVGVRVALGSITPTAGGSITLQVYAVQGAVVPDFVAGAGDTYTQPLTTTTSAKNLYFPMVRAYPRSLRFVITNNAGVALAATGNSLAVSAYDESVA
jgi:hypothetical protein